MRPTLIITSELFKYTRDHDARCRARPNTHWRCSASIWQWVNFSKENDEVVQSLSRINGVPVKNKGKTWKKSVYSIFIHDTIGFLDQTHRVAKQGKLRI